VIFHVKFQPFCPQKQLKFPALICGRIGLIPKLVRARLKQHEMLFSTILIIIQKEEGLKILLVETILFFSTIGFIIPQLPVVFIDILSYGGKACQNVSLKYSLNS